MKKISEFKTFLDQDIIGNRHFEIKGVCTFFDLKEESVTWINPDREVNWADIYLPDNILIILQKLPDLEIQHSGLNKNVAFLLSENPKKTFSRCIEELILDKIVSRGNWYDAERSENIFIHETAIVKCNIDKSIVKNLKIGPNAFVSENVQIANNVKIGPGTVIGGDGFGFYDEESGRSVRMPHLGGVVLEENVEIGANTTIDRGTIGNTILMKNSKIDNLVHIAHNVVVGENSKVVANTTLCGSVDIGENVWIGGNSIIRQGLIVGNNSIVGIGSTVVKKIPQNETWAGSPAKKIK